MQDFTERDWDSPVPLDLLAFSYFRLLLPSSDYELVGLGPPTSRSWDEQYSSLALPSTPYPNAESGGAHHACFVVPPNLGNDNLDTASSAVYTTEATQRGLRAMICPVCEYDMIVLEYRSIELDYCNNCKGIWFDSGELELLLQSQGLEETKTFLDDVLNFQEVSSPERKRDCPICGRRMKKTAIGRQSEIIIDICRDEHGLWFDGGEVTQLMRHLAAEHPAKLDSGDQVIGFLEEVFKRPD